MADHPSKTWGFRGAPKPTPTFAPKQGIGAAQTIQPDIETPPVPSDAIKSVDSKPLDLAASERTTSGRA